MCKLSFSRLPTKTEQQTPPEWVDVSSSATSSKGCLDVRAWRVKRCEWSYEVVDHFNVNRCIVEISFSYFDRFLATRQKNKHLFQLAAMTTLYLAIKLFETKSLKIMSFIELSHDSFTINHIAAMELIILRSLSMYLHPPTTLALRSYLIHLLPIECGESLTYDVLELSRFLCEPSVCDCFFVTHKS